MTTEADLRRQVAELQDELAEWEAGDRNALEAQFAAEEVADMMGAFRMNKSQARVALALAKRPGRCLTRAYLDRLCRLGEGSGSNLVDVQIMKVRRKLRAPIRNVFGLGWVMEAPAANQVLRAIAPTH